MNGGVFLSLCDTKATSGHGRLRPLCPRDEDNMTPPFMGAIKR